MLGRRKDLNDLGPERERGALGNRDRALERLERLELAVERQDEAVVPACLFEVVVGGPSGGELQLEAARLKAERRPRRLAILVPVPLREGLGGLRPQEEEHSVLQEKRQEVPLAVLLVLSRRRESASTVQSSELLARRPVLAEAAKATEKVDILGEQRSSS